MHEIPERSALNFFPEEITFKNLKAAAAGCMGCDLYKNATQTVFGEGPTKADVLFVGEQPGDEEDLGGRPFIGPAGRLFNRALEEAGIDRSRTYVTNAVKHFKWKPQGKRRLHQKPKASEIEACLPWLAAELEVVEPRILVMLGATAAQALLGKQFRVTQQRGIWLDSPMAENTIATVHPSSILRAGDERALQYSQFIDDLKVVAAAMPR
ncbi:MAG TPA: UdgX family uracil-DNA binding protein [Pyrinomonadaceae bacterium]|nr:UdgX family uracil-DNA binding protein [Pyrinomonadaceae bacterium]